MISPRIHEGLMMPRQSTPTGGTDGAEQFLPARRVWERYGVTSMTLWRWLKDADLKFPQPMRIGRLRYWRLSDLVSWEAEIDLEVEARATAERVRDPRVQP
jgi:predicted DNA-binding transcriptional regulator AlpA